MRALSDRVRSINPARLDALVALAIMIELQLESWLDNGITGPHRVPTAVAAVLTAAPVAVRRRWPAGALVGCAAVGTIEELLGGRLSATTGLGTMLALVLLAYSVGAWLELRDGLVALLLAFAIFAAGFVFHPSSTATGGIGAVLFFAGLVFAAPWAVGRLARERNRRAGAFRQLAAQTSAERQERKRAAIAHERLRIGSDLQDVIAHSVSAMVIQAGGARQLLRDDPDRARDSILAVERTGREALADLRGLLGMLRKDDDARALAPQPGLDQLPALLETAREAGLDCRLETEGTPIDLTPGVDLVGYRVVEAALQIAAEHDCHNATVTARYDPNQVDLEIRGDTPILDLEHEMRGIAERVALYDGSLRVLTADGFALRAQLPLWTAVPA